MTDIDEQAAIEPERHPDSRRSRRWMVPALAAIVIAGAAAAVLTDRSAPTDDVETVGSDREVSDVALADDSALGELVLAIMDDSLTVEQRVALVHDPDQIDPSAHAVLGSFDELAARAGVTDAQVVGTKVIGDAAVVDVDITLDGTFGTSVNLSSFVARRVDGSWLLTPETVCGLAQQAATVAAATTCTGAERLRHASAQVSMVDLLLGGAGAVVDTDAATVLETGWWNAELIAIDSDWWFIDYPEEQLGGGGPAGPAHLVRVDASGAETARVELAGTNAQLVGGDDLLWVLHYLADDGVTDPSAEGAVAGPQLVAVDAASAQILSSTPTGPLEYPAASNGDDLFVVEGATLHRYDGRTLQRAGSVELGILPTANLVTTTKDQLWLDDAGGRAVVVSMDDMATSERAIPQGQVVGSGDQMWSLRHRGGSTSIERIEPGSGTPPLSMDGVRFSTAWADGNGGIWVMGDVGSSTSTTASLHMPVVSRPMALHVLPDGSIEQTWWLEGSGSAMSRWFVPAGDGLALAGPSGVTLLSD